MWKSNEPLALWVKPENITNKNMSVKVIVLYT
jgi:hypothetical protein